MAFSDPACMSIRDRRAELAGLLATGFLRMRCRKGYVPPAAVPGPAVVSAFETAPKFAAEPAAETIESAVEAGEAGSKTFDEKLSDSAWFTQKNEAKCRPRGVTTTRKGWCA